jgi:hypothetical protein
LASSVQIRTMYASTRSGIRASSLLWCSHKKKKCVPSPCTYAVNSRPAAVALLWASMEAARFHVAAVPVHEGDKRRIQVRPQKRRGRIGIGERCAEQLVARLMDFVPCHALAGTLPVTTQIAPPSTEARPAWIGASRSPSPSKPGSKFIQTATPNGMSVQRL